MTRAEIRRLDHAFSKLIRSRGACERCGSKRYLQTSHIYSRRYLSVRWDPLNANCFCAGCHWWWTLNPLEAGEWVKTFLGTRYEDLKARKSRLGKGLSVDMVKAGWTAKGGSWGSYGS